MRKIIVTVAPVCHVGKEIPEECKNPLTPEEITEDVVNCYKAGACQVHLHTRDLKGNPTFELDVFQKTINMIREKTDMIIQGSTGGLSTLTLEERCVSLNVPEVEVASLNMGSVNFAETVYINTMPELRYWAKRQQEADVVPEMELFDLSHVECCSRLADEGVIRRPLHYNYCVGPGASSNLSATGRNLALLNMLAEQGTSWGVNHDSMKDFSILACAIGMGANAVRVGFEDSFYYAPGKRAHTNAELVERLVALIRMMGCEPATPEEAREMLHIGTYWK
ncbi:MAG: 3-keto-5-aminohexanoate cleavage protein [Prevotella sp.]|jgi:3-keto-5-aminohexanoate cleavage enzyme|nr:3-keto-5-aminohexanoate cleavage protein [Prevotella sp.]MEE1121798.1 3-keto-5-aminohexanoate cleavage protein [Prevotella sp.]